MGANPSKWKGPRNSVEMFSWKDARDFCRTVTELLRAEKLLDPDEEIRLPSEAEWEYCCRAGTQTVYSFGDDATKEGDAGTKASRLNEFGWHTGNAAGNDPPVGALKPNPWGLYDMHGNVNEWCQDWYGDYTGGIALDPQGPATGSDRMERGGDWGYDARFKTEMSEFNLPRAKALLDMHGYTDKDGDGWRELPDGKPLVLEYSTQPDQLSRQLAELWQKSMNSIGLRIVFKSAKWPENLKASR